MKKYSLIASLIIALIYINLLITSCVIRRSEPVKQRSFVPQTNRIAHGEQVFMAYCNKCHPAGESGLGPSINGNPAPQFIKRFQMRHGLGVMPAFTKNEISKKDLRAISKYLKAWKHY